MSISEHLVALEDCIRQIARQFVKNGGEGAFDLYCEAEIEATLFSQLRRLPLMKVLDQDGYHRQLVHLHWPCVRGRYIDVVMWHPRDVTSYRGDWGHSLPKTAPSRRLLGAVQIKLGGGRIVPKNAVEKDLEDLTSIGKAAMNRLTQLYFIAFIDRNIRESRSTQRYSDVKKVLERWCDRDAGRRKVLFLSKDRVGFAYPRGRWAVDPLPASVVELPK